MDTHNKFSLAILLFFMVQHTCVGQNSPQDYVDAHNAARSEVGVENIEWDNDAAAFAQDYVNSRVGDCRLVHSPLGSNYGENIAIGGGDFPGGDFTGEMAVDLWVKEKRFYNPEYNTCALGKKCGHYTQVVWRDSVRVGCAREQCYNGEWFVSCNYDPPGNVIGLPPY